MVLWERRRPRSWQTAIAAEQARLRQDLLIACSVPSDADEQERNRQDAICTAIGDSLFVADFISKHATIPLADSTDPPRRTFRSPWRRIRTTGSEVEAAWAALNRASEGLLLIQAAECAVAMIPELRAEVKSRLGANDPRFDEYLRALDSIDQKQSESDDVVARVPPSAAALRT